MSSDVTWKIARIVGCSSSAAIACAQSGAYERLSHFDTKKNDASTTYLLLEIYKHGLTGEQAQKWQAILNAKGRVPFILYPVICSKCGALWPEFFMVSDEEWAYYIPPDKRQTVICAECYGYIKQRIDETKGPFIAT